MANGTIGATAPPQFDPAQVEDVAPTTGERVRTAISGFLKGATGRPGQKSPLDEAVERHHQARLNEARMYRQSAAEIAGILATGVDPKTGQPLTDEQRQTYQDQYNAAWAAYEKAAGVNKETKGALGRAKAIMGHIMGQGRPQGATPPPQAPGAGGDGAPPSAPAGAAPGDASAPKSGAEPIPNALVGGGPPAEPIPDAKPGERATVQPLAQAPPPPKFTMQDAVRAQAEAGQASQWAGEAHTTQAMLAQRRALAKEAGLTPGTNEYREFMATGRFPATYGHLQTPKMYKDTEGNSFMGLPDENGQIVDTNTGRVVPGALATTPGADAPHQFTYADAQGLPHPALRMGTKFVDGITKEPLPPGTKVFSAWIAPRTTTTHGWREVQQPDGSIALVPVETTSVREPGRPGESKAAPSGGAGAPAKPSAGDRRVPRTVGGKVPPGVAKAYEAFNSAQERFNVMQAALPDAQKGDQQAMLNLLANHVGMTMGLQKGARITQTIVDEAQQSAPLVGRLAARFDADGYLTGVVLTPEQMAQMIKLAKVRLREDEGAWKREVTAAKKGYGMVPDTPAKPGAVTPPPSAAPKTWKELKQQLQQPSP